MEAVTDLYDRIVDQELLVRRVNVTLTHVEPECEQEEEPYFEQMNLFTDYEAEQKSREKKKDEREKERRMQQAMLDIKKKYGKNAILKGMNLEEGATARERNHQIGGHKA